jgi:hypothetical protein
MKLCEHCDKLPTSLFITGAERMDIDAVFGGGFADIFRASHNGEVVALKRLRIFLKDNERQKLHRVSGHHYFFSFALLPLGLLRLEPRGCVAKLSHGSGYNTKTSFHSSVLTLRVFLLVCAWCHLGWTTAHFVNSYWAIWTLIWTP